MNKPAFKSPPPLAHWTYADMHALIPIDWFSATLCICDDDDSFDRAFVVKRISFHTNKDGRRILVIASSPKSARVKL